MIDAIGNSIFTSGAMATGLAASRSTGPQATSATAGAEFSAVMQDVISSATASLRQGEAAAIGGMQGTVPVQQVVEQVMDAERTVQAAIAIRDKLVGAYLEINRMQI